MKIFLDSYTQMRCTLEQLRTTCASKENICYTKHRIFTRHSTKYFVPNLRYTRIPFQLDVDAKEWGS